MILYAPKIHLLEGDTGYRVPFRNTLLHSLYPDISIAVLKASTNPDDYNQILNLLAAEEEEADAPFSPPLSLDFATGAKKRGEFIATDAAVSRRFWNTPEQAAAYGSNLLTDCCQEPIVTPLRVLIVEDQQHATGDCHAKMGLGLAYELGHTKRAAQFRIAFDRFLAKGTVIHDPNVDTQQVDIIIPLSAFKSSEKPALGIHHWPNPHVAIQGWSQPLRVKCSYTILQWFTRRTIDHDVWPHIQPQIDTLIEASQSPEAASKLLHLDLDTDDPDQPLLARILTADIHNLLIHHPWVINKLTRLLRRRWLHLALGGGLKFTGLQGLPDDSLPIGIISTPDLPYGPVIATRYPVRSWADIRIWRNVRAKRHHHFVGTVWMNHQTAALVGGDFDGDYFIFLPAKRFPLMTTEIRRWHHTRQPPPVVKVKERMASDWSALPKVMMDNTDNMVGLITYFIAQANAMHRLDFVNALAPELQIAVDKFKYNLTHDLDKIKSISSQLEALDWLADRKSHDAFTKRPIHVTPQATDTISYLANRVAATWQPPNLITSPLESFAPLFPNAQHHTAAARQLTRRYGKQVAAIIRSGDRNAFSPIFHALTEWAETRQDTNQWTNAIWHAVHRPGRKGTGSLAFHAFPDQLLARLHQPQRLPPRIDIVGLPYHQHANHLPQFQGQPYHLTVTQVTFNDHIRSLIHVANLTLGLASSETPLPPGLYTLHLTWNQNKVVYATKGHNND